MRALTILQDGIATRGKNSAKWLYRPALIHSAAMYRRVLDKVQFVGVTGSCGKTTTNYLIHAVLSRFFNAHKSRDTNNQLYSVARTIFGLTPGTEYCVQEIGATGPGSLDAPVRLLNPHVAVITAIGTDHYTAFRSREAVAAEKGKLVRALTEHGVAILNHDDPHVCEMKRLCRGRVITYGITDGADIRATGVSSRWPECLKMIVDCADETVELRTRLYGTFMAGCVLPAIATGVAAGIPLRECAAAVEACEPTLGRMSVHDTGMGIVFIRDDWKAPYWSAEAPLEFMRTARASRKLIVLGTISDRSGSLSSKDVGLAKQALGAANHVVFIGPRSSKLQKIQIPEPGKTLQVLPDIAAARGFLRRFLKPGDLVLLKGSNPADHLGRLALMFNRTVGCWRQHCGRVNLCDHCRLLELKFDRGA